MKVYSQAGFGRALMRDSKKDIARDEVTLIYEQRNGEHETVGAFVPAAIWFQLQGFVARVIERV